MKTIILCIFILSVTTSCFAQYGNETITITTYYPSPHGVYGVLTLYPRTAEPENPRQGDMYYNITTDKIVHYNKTGVWVNITDASLSGGGDTLVGAAHSVSDCRNAGGEEISSDTSLKLCQFSNPSGVICPAGWTRYKSFTTTEAKTVTANYPGGSGCPTSCTSPGHSWSNQQPACCAVRDCYIPKQCDTCAAGGTCLSFDVFTYGCSGERSSNPPYCGCWSMSSSACSSKYATATVTQIGCY